MTYKSIIDQVKNALGLSSADDARLVSELDMLLYDISAYAPWWHLRHAETLTTNASGLLPAFSAAPMFLGMIYVITNATHTPIYYTDGVIPRNTGRMFWRWDYDTDQVLVTGTDGLPLASTALSVAYWTLEDATGLTTANVATREFQFPAVAPFLSGLRGRWFRYQELKAEEAGQFESVYAADLKDAVIRDRKGASPMVVSIGGVNYSTSDRILL